MSEIRKFLPFVVTIARESKPLLWEGRQLRWSIVVCDREYDLLFASWLRRKPTNAQISRVASELQGREWQSGQDVAFYLYHDTSIQTQGTAQWAEYGKETSAVGKTAVYSRKGLEQQDAYGLSTRD